MKKRNKLIISVLLTLVTLFSLSVFVMGGSVTKMNSCIIPADCVHDLTCRKVSGMDQPTCLEPQTEGGYCNHSINCADGMQCVDSKCAVATDSSADLEREPRATAQDREQKKRIPSCKEKDKVLTGDNCMCIFIGGGKECSKGNVCNAFSGCTTKKQFESKKRADAEGKTAMQGIMPYSSASCKQAKSYLQAKAELTKSDHIEFNGWVEPKDGLSSVDKKVAETLHSKCQFKWSVNGEERTLFINKRLALNEKVKVQVEYCDSDKCYGKMPLKKIIQKDVDSVIEDTDKKFFKKYSQKMDGCTPQTCSTIQVSTKGAGTNDYESVFQGQPFGVKPGEKYKVRIKASKEDVKCMIINGKQYKRDSKYFTIFRNEHDKAWSFRVRGFADKECSIDIPTAKAKVSFFADNINSGAETSDDMPLGVNISELSDQFNQLKNRAADPNITPNKRNQVYRELIVLKKKVDFALKNRGKRS